MNIPHLLQSWSFHLVLKAREFLFRCPVSTWQESEQSRFLALTDMTNIKDISFYFIENKTAIYMIMYFENDKNVTFIRSIARSYCIRTWADIYITKLRLFHHNILIILSSIL